MRNGNLNPGAVRQISSGSIIGELLFIGFDVLKARREARGGKY